MRTKIKNQGAKSLWVVVGIILLLGVSCFGFSTSLQAGGVWLIQTVDSSGNVLQERLSLALDSNNYPHISYCDALNGDLKYARWNGTAWAIQTVDSEGNVGTHNSIALDSSNNPHISYFSNWNLKHARWNGATWVIQTVDSPGQPCGYISLALDGNGYPHISYYVSGLRILKYANWNGTSWDKVTVDTTVYSSYTSLALDSNSYPHISYCSDNGLRYAKWNGTSWYKETVVSNGSAADPGNSLALDSNNYPHIAYKYHVGFDNHLKYARWNGTSWSIQTVDTGTGNTGYFCSLALDSSDYPHISYHDQSVNDLNYARWNGTAWVIQMVDSAYHMDRAAGRGSSLALDSSNNPHIAYHYRPLFGSPWGYGYLKYATLGTPITAMVDIKPNVLNKASQGGENAVTVYIEIPGYDVNAIDMSAVTLSTNKGVARAQLKPTEVGDYDRDGIADRMVKFDRQAVIAIVDAGEKVKLTINGTVAGTIFEGSAEIRVIEQKK